MCFFNRIIVFNRLPSFVFACLGCLNLSHASCDSFHEGFMGNTQAMVCRIVVNLIHIFETFVNCYKYFESVDFKTCSPPAVCGRKVYLRSSSPGVPHAQRISPQILGVSTPRRNPAENPVRSIPGMPPERKLHLHQQFVWGWRGSNHFFPFEGWIPKSMK